jgi:hypothetical protein
MELCTTPPPPEQEETPIIGESIFSLKGKLFFKRIRYFSATLFVD